MENKISTAVILVGGLGTRLRSVINDLPKPLADINGKPFLAHLIDYLIKYKFKKIILASGYLSDKIEKYFSDYSKDVEILFSVEKERLGTGGAVKLAIQNYDLKNDFLLLNGDSILSLDINNFINNHKSNNLSIALKKMIKPHRYGTVKLNNNFIEEFKEKQEIDEGIINTGIYAINPKIISNISADKFSFEKEILEKIENIYGYVYDDYFVDIGIPEDYEKAEKELLKYLH